MLTCRIGVRIPLVINPPDPVTNGNPSGQIKEPWDGKVTNDGHHAYMDIVKKP